ncbi:MAG: dTMP kinase [Armatimonadetes bacterium]|nr:dTMP kinase [Armatimonadota bacterium]
MFITLEGPDGSGKSTLAKGLCAALQARGFSVVLTREPGEGEFGASIRSILLHGGDMSQKAELFLFLADRAEHVESFVKPALEAGKIVICDRYADSTVVYQGYARGLHLDLLRELNTFATTGLVPDLTLLLDLPPEVGISRVPEKNRLDSASADFHIAVRNGFLAEAKLEPGRFAVLDAMRSAEDVLAGALEVVDARLRMAGRV